jgi:signal transduction histidine kinase
MRLAGVRAISIPERWEFQPGKSGKRHILGVEADAVLRDGVSVQGERRLIPLEQDGKIQDRYWDYSYSPLFERGRVAGVLLITRDVTHDIVANRRLSKLASTLEHVLEVNAEGVVMLDREWRFTHLNKQARELIAPAGDVLGRVAWDAFPAMIYPDSPYVYHYCRAMDEGIPGEFVGEYPAPLNLTIHIAVRPYPDGIIVFFRDITEERRREAVLVQTEKLAAVGKMASSIAHEINNPLEAVTNLLYLARRSNDTGELQHFLEDADQELRRVSNIVNQTLRFHKQASNPQAVSCVTLFTAVLNMYQARLLNAGIAVEKRKRATLLVDIYEGDIRQVLNNLVGNAIDAMPNGGRLLVRSREATDWRTGRRGLVLTVADTGVGMDDHTKARVFDAFFTTKGIGGTGLGMWVSSEIMERHGGSIRIRSRQGEGRSGTVAAMFLPFEGVKRPSGGVG